MTATAQVLKEAQVIIEFTTRKSKGPVHKDERGTVTGYTLFSAKVACDLCERPHQPERQVKMEIGERTIRAGLSCLYQVTGIGESKLETASRGQISIALKARGLAHQLGNKAISFETIADVLNRIRHDASAILQDAQHGNSVLAEIEELTRRLTERKVNNADEKRLTEIFEYLSYINDAKQNPERHHARVRALLGDPWAYKERQNAPVMSLPLHTPTELTPDNVATVKRTLAEVARLQGPPLRTPAVDPREYETRDEYLSALEAHYQRLVQRGEELRPKLQAQYDTVHFGNYGRLREMDVLGSLTLPCVTPVYKHAALNHLDLDGSRGRKLLGQRHSVNEVSCCASGKGRMTEVRIDLPDRRTDDRGRERAARPEDRRMVDTWFVAYWIPDPWSGMFPVWRQHGGREALLKFPMPE